MGGRGHALDSDGQREPECSSSAQYAWARRELRAGGRGSGETTLFPGGVDVDLATVPASSIESPEAEAAAPARMPSIVAAVSEGATLHVLLSRSHPDPLELELSNRGASPDDWSPAPQVPPSIDAVSFELDVVGGSRLRLVSTDEHGSGREGRPFCDRPRVRAAPPAACRPTIAHPPRQGDRPPG